MKIFHLFDEIHFGNLFFRKFSLALYYITVLLVFPLFSPSRNFIFCAILYSQKPLLWLWDFKAHLFFCEWMNEAERSGMESKAVEWVCFGSVVLIACKRIAS